MTNLLYVCLAIILTQYYFMYTIQQTLRTYFLNILSSLNLKGSFPIFLLMTNYIEKNYKK